MPAVAEIVAGSGGGAGLIQGLPLRWLRRRGPQAAQGRIDPTRGGGRTSGGRCGGSPPAQGRAAGPTVQNCSGQWPVAGNVKGKGSIHEFAGIFTNNVNCGLCQGGVAGGVPPHKGGPSGPTVQKEPGKRIPPLRPRVDQGLAMRPLQPDA